MQYLNDLINRRIYEHLYLEFMLSRKEELLSKKPILYSLGCNIMKGVCAKGGWGMAHCVLVLRVLFLTSQV